MESKLRDDLLHQIFTSIFRNVFAISLKSARLHTPRKLTDKIHASFAKKK